MTFSFTATTPSGVGGSSYYARILTYTSDSVAAAYTDTVPGTHLDDGGIALSTANQLTITARVQEVLQFCVGTTDAASANDCTDISGTSIDLGVVDSSTVSASSNAAGLAMLRTNAVNGATITYFAEQGAGTTHLGALRVPGVTCTGSGIVGPAAGSMTDQCFNSAAAAQASNATSSIVAGIEAFGMNVYAVDTSNGSTTSLTKGAEYDGTGTTGVTCNSGTGAGCWTWDSTGTLGTLATSTTVVDDEMLNLKFAATAAPTTPTGAYSVTATFVATGTF